MKFGKDRITDIIEKMKTFGFDKKEVEHLLVALVTAAAEGFARGMVKEWKKND